MPKVSICIPTYNNLSGLIKCLDSVFLQDYTDYEVVITDDSSNNDIAEYINTLQNHKIAYYKNQKPLGSPENWNEGIKKSNAEWIKIMHHDDWFTYPNSLRIFVELMAQNPDCNIGFVASRSVNSENIQTLHINKPEADYVARINEYPNEMLRGNFVGAPSATIFRKNNTIFFDPKTIWLVDIDFYINTIKIGKLCYNDRDAISIGLSPSQISKSVGNDKKTNIFEYFYLLNKYGIKKISKTTLFPPYKKIIKRFHIKSISDIRNAGYEGDLPIDIHILFEDEQEELPLFSLKKIINFIKEKIV